MEILKKSASVCFATFSPYLGQKRDPKNGNIEPMISFFAKRVKRFLLIDQPHTGSDTVIPVIEEYLKGKIAKKFKLAFFLYKPLYWLLKKINLTDDDTNILFKIRDFISVLHVGLTSKEKFDYFIGLESINTLASLILKKANKVKKVIYYTSDYSPVRYSNKFFNWVYLFLDRICCYNADFIWDVSRAMLKARLSAGVNDTKIAPVISVPNALFPKFIKHLPIEKLKPNSLVFMGSLGYENGADLAIESLPLVVKKFPDTILNIIGGRKTDLKRLGNLAKSLKLIKNVKFYGMIPKDGVMFSILRQFYLGLAPYLRLKNSVRFFGDSLKLRAYMAAGLPAITTEVPPLGKELESYGSAIIAKDNKDDLAKAIIKILSDEDLYKKYRNRAIEYGKNNTWQNTYKKALEQMSKYN